MTIKKKNSNFLLRLFVHTTVHRLYKLLEWKLNQLSSALIVLLLSNALTSQRFFF